MQNDVPRWYREEFVKRYGAVSRSRGCYLYTQKGVRITDMYQDAGRAVLGRGCSGSKAFKVFKNTLERGQTGSFPCMYERRFEKAALTLVSGYDYARWFRCEESLFEAVSESVWYAAAKKNAGIKLWRPWLADSSVLKPPCVNSLFARGAAASSDVFFIPDLIVLYPPFALYESGYVALFKENNGAVPPCSDTCSPALLNALARALYDLLYELPRRTEKDWAIFDSELERYFTRIGPYLIPKIKKSEYRDFVIHCLDCALLVPPECTVPALVPVGAAEGDFSKLKRRPF